MKLILDRGQEEKGLSHGELTLPSGIKLCTLELEWKDNKSNISRIPSGSYTCKKVNSPRFGDTYEITNVPDRTNVLFHKGNAIEDTRGCVLLGLRRTVDHILDSLKAFTFFMQEMQEDEFELEIK